MLFSGALSLQHGNVIFKWILTCSFLFTIILQAADGHACFQKGELCSELLCVFYLIKVTNRYALSPAVRQFSFAGAPHVLIMFGMISDEGVGSTMVNMFLRGAW